MALLMGRATNRGFTPWSARLSVLVLVLVSGIELCVATATVLMRSQEPWVRFIDHGTVSVGILVLKQPLPAAMMSTDTKQGIRY